MHESCSVAGRTARVMPFAVRTLKTSEAAAVLNVSPNTLRAWERRFGYPKPQRTPGKHRLYTHGEVAALRDALQEGLSISSAVSRAREALTRRHARPRRRARRPSSSTAPTPRWRRRSRCARSSAPVEEVLLPSLDELGERHGSDSAPWAFAARWAADWLQPRAAPRAAADRARPPILIGDATRDDLDPDALALRALRALLRARRRPRARRCPSAASPAWATSLDALRPAGASSSPAATPRDDDVARWAYARALGRRRRCRSRSSAAARGGRACARPAPRACRDRPARRTASCWRCSSAAAIRHGSRGTAAIADARPRRRRHARARHDRRPRLVATSPATPTVRAVRRSAATAAARRAPATPDAGARVCAPLRPRACSSARRRTLAPAPSDAFLSSTRRSTVCAVSAARRAAARRRARPTRSTATSPTCSSRPTPRPPAPSALVHSLIARRARRRRASHDVVVRPARRVRRALRGAHRRLRPAARPRCSCLGDGERPPATAVGAAHGSSRCTRTCRDCSDGLRARCASRRAKPRYIARMGVIRTNAAAAMLGRQPEHAALLGAPLRLPEPAPHARAATGSSTSPRSRRCAPPSRRRTTSPRRSRSPASAAPAPRRRRACASALRPLRRGRGRPRRSRRASPSARSSARSRRSCCPRVEALGEDGDRPAPEYGFAWRWATGWLAAQPRVAPPAHARRGRPDLRRQRARCDVDALHAQALELVLRRAGLRTLTLAVDLDPAAHRPRAARASTPRAVVLTGRRASLDALGRLVYAARRVGGDAVAVFDFRGALPETGASTVAAPRRPRRSAARDEARSPRLDGPASAAAPTDAAPRARLRSRRSSPRAVRPRGHDSARDDARARRPAGPPRARVAAARRGQRPPPPVGRPRARGPLRVGFSVLVVLATAGGELELRALRQRLRTSKANATEVVDDARGARPRRARAPAARPPRRGGHAHARGREIVDRLFPEHTERVAAARSRSSTRTRSARSPRSAASSPPERGRGEGGLGPGGRSRRATADRAAGAGSRQPRRRRHGRRVRRTKTSRRRCRCWRLRRGDRACCCRSCADMDSSGRRSRRRRCAPTRLAARADRRRWPRGRARRRARPCTGARVDGAGRRQARAAARRPRARGRSAGRRDRLRRRGPRRGDPRRIARPARRRGHAAARRLRSRGRRRPALLQSPANGAPSRRSRAVLPRPRGGGARALARARRLPRVAAPPRGRRAVGLLRGPADRQRPARRRTTSSRASSRTSTRASRRCAATYVERKGGWDCHGLPVEIAVEQQLGIDDQARDRGLRHRRVQRAVPRVGLRVPRGLERADRADRLLGRPRRRLPHARRRPTSSRSGGRCSRSATRACSTRATRSCPYCPRCGTALSSHEVALGYQDVVDPSVYVRFPVAEDGGPLQAGDELLVWTTTPWTLVSNAAVAVDPELTYVRAKTGALERAGGARRGARRARCSARTRRSSSASPAPRSTACATSRRSRYIAGARVRRARPHRAARRLRHRRRRHRPRAHGDRLRRGRLPARRAVRPERRQPGAARRHLRRAHRPATPGASSRTPTPTSSRTCARAAGCCAPRTTSTPTRTAGAAATPLLYYAKPSWYIATSQLRDRAARRQRDGRLAPRAHQARALRQLAGEQRRLGAVARALLGHAAAGLALRGRPRALHRVASTSSRSSRGVRARGPAPPVRRRRRRSRARSAASAMTRVPEVIDVWFDSGAMPFAQ